MNRNKIYLILIMLAIFILRIPGLYQPILDIDECAFAEFANKIIEGSIPYIDVVDNKPPLTYYTIAIIFLIFGKNNLLAVHLVTTFIVMATALMVYITGKEIQNEKIGIISALIFTALAHTYEPKYISTSGEALINLPLILSSFMFIKYQELKKAHIPAFMICGLSLGIATMINYKAGILAIVFSIQGLLIRGTLAKTPSRVRSLSNELIRLSITGICTLIPITIILAYFYHKGNLEEFLYWGFTYNFRYIETGSQAMPILKTVGRIGYFIFCTLPIWYLSLIYIKKGLLPSTREILQKSDSRGQSYFFLLLWLIFSFYAATLGGRTYGHYFIQLAVPLALLSGIAYVDVSAMSRRGIKFFWGFLATITVILFFSRIDINTTYRIINYPNWRSDINYRSVGDYIKENSSPQSSIYAWGYATPIYYYSDRRCSTRFLISDYISGRVFGTPNDSTIIRSSQDREAWRDFMSDLQVNPPIYFVDTSTANHFGYSRFPIKNYPELHEYISKNYRLDRMINKINIYKRVH
jgi:4-amino-4-deoxy-L-arabinose transferase-like glycosyltransferase